MNWYKTISRIAVNTARIILALTFIFSGFIKAIDPLGTQYKIHDYLVAMDLIKFVPDYVTLMVAVALAVFEFWLGIGILFAIRRRLVSHLMLSFMLVFTALTVWIAVADPVSDCGCFGDAIKLTNVQTLVKNIILLVCAIIMASSPKSMTRFVSESNQWIVMNYSVVFLLAISGASLYYLPMFDFRPYHEGAELKDNLDFFAYDEETGDDITDSIVNGKGYTFMLIAPHLENADDSQLDLINEMYEYSQTYNYGFFCLTASEKEAQEHWNDITGAEYNYYQADDITLKTMIRSNPGMVLVKDGKIIRKWSHNSLPDEYVLDKPLHQLEIGEAPESMVWQKVTNIIVWFVIPLLLLTIADRMWAWTSLIRRKNRLISLTNKNKKIMAKKIVAGNWKMNKNLQEGVALATELKEVVTNPNCEVIIGTPFIHLATVAELLKDSCIAVSAENCANKASGAYTGEVSAEMVKSTGAEYVILGHSERREYYNETPEILKEKVDLALANGLKVIFCIGESLEQREANEQEAVCKAELEGSVFHLTAEQWKNVVIAYEPIWAIGTGKTATADQAEEIHAYIRKCVADVYGAEAAAETSILYGGSCKASNAPELFAKPDIDGGLIGGASLKAADFKGIIDAWN